MKINYYFFLTLVISMLLIGGCMKEAKRVDIGTQKTMVNNSYSHKSKFINNANFYSSTVYLKFLKETSETKIKRLLYSMDRVTEPKIIPGLNLAKVRLKQSKNVLSHSEMVNECNDLSQFSYIENIIAMSHELDSAGETKKISGIHKANMLDKQLKNSDLTQLYEFLKEKDAYIYDVQKNILFIRFNEEKMNSSDVTSALNEHFLGSKSH